MALWLTLTLQTTLIAYAAIGGVFLAFSDFVMRALATTSGTGGIEAMQSINREVFRWVTIPVFMVLVPISLGLAGYGIFAVGGPQGWLIAAAGLLYVLGCLAVTGAGNVPLNEALAGMDATVEQTQHYWQDTYLPRWTRLNTIRAVACLAAAALLLTALAWPKSV